MSPVLVTSTLRMETIASYETSVITYETTQYENLEYQNPNFYWHGSSNRIMRGFSTVQVTGIDYLKKLSIITLMMEAVSISET
jgi:hypothetical protein